MIFLQTGQEIDLFDTLLDIAGLLGVLGIIGAFAWLYWKNKPPKR